MYCILLCEDSCPQCGTANWVYCGDPNDMTAPGIEAIKCYHCGTTWELESSAIIDEENSCFCDEGAPTAQAALG